MKFCKNLQRVVDISNPEWSPYWVNYKMLKKLIKELPSLVQPEESVGSPDPSTAASSPEEARVRAESKEDYPNVPSTAPAAADDSSSDGIDRQNHGDQTAEGGQIGRFVANGKDPTTRAQAMERSPGEVAFFKLLHSEYRKATHFFDRAEQELSIREERVREGLEIMKKPNSIMVNDKWSLIANSLYRLYKDLLLLETFAIMTYCAFSKILKKHDKVTRYDTRNAFMANVVNQANFTNYPKLLLMINRCESMYEEVSQHLNREGQAGLCEDERLFINMIHRLNAQVLDTADQEGFGQGAPDHGDRKRSLQDSRVSGQGMATPPSPSSSARSAEETRVAESLRSLVEENEARTAAGLISAEESTSVGASEKRSATEPAKDGSSSKRIKTSSEG